MQEKPGHLVWFVKYRRSIFVTDVVIQSPELRNKQLLMKDGEITDESRDEVAVIKALREMSGATEKRRVSDEMFPFHVCIKASAP